MRYGYSARHSGGRSGMDDHRGRHDGGGHKDEFRGRHDNDRDHGQKHHDDAHDSGDQPVAGNLLTGESVSWTLQGKGVTVEITAMLDDMGNVVLSYEKTGGTADLNGLYIDIGNDGGPISSLGCGNNMRGSDTDGDKLDGFDFAQKLGSTGGHDADNTSGTVVVSMADLGITSLEELAESEIGVRATSVGESRECSVKLADTGEYHKEDAPTDPCDQDSGDGSVTDTGDFPNGHAPATRLTLVFAPETDGEGNWWPATGDQNDDWYYTVQINLSGDVSTDPDDYFQQLVADLTAADANVGDTSIVKGVFIETDCDDTDFFYYYYNANSTLPDELPHGFEIDPIDGTVGPVAMIDASFDATYIDDTFVFA